MDRDSAFDASVGGKVYCNINLARVRAHGPGAIARWCLDLMSYESSFKRSRSASRYMAGLFYTQFAGLVFGASGRHLFARLLFISAEITFLTVKQNN